MIFLKQKTHRNRRFLLKRSWQLVRLYTVSTRHHEYRLSFKLLCEVFFISYRIRVSVFYVFFFSSSTAIEMLISRCIIIQIVSVIADLGLFRFLEISALCNWRFWLQGKLPNTWQTAITDKMDVYLDWCKIKMMTLFNLKRKSVEITDNLNKEKKSLTI